MLKPGTLINIYFNDDTGVAKCSVISHDSNLLTIRMSDGKTLIQNLNSTNFDCITIVEPAGFNTEEPD